VEGRLLPGVEEMKPLLAKLPRVRSSWATRRVSSIAIIVRLEAVETRLTPSHSSVARSGVAARPTMLMGDWIARVSLPIVSASVTAKGKMQSAPRHQISLGALLWQSVTPDRQFASDRYRSWH